MLEFNNVIIGEPYRNPFVFDIVLIKKFFKLARLFLGQKSSSSSGSVTV